MLLVNNAMYLIVIQSILFKIVRHRGLDYLDNFTLFYTNE